MVLVLVNTTYADIIVFRFVDRSPARSLAVTRHQLLSRFLSVEEGLSGNRHPSSLIAASLLRVLDTVARAPTIHSAEPVRGQARPRKRSFRSSRLPSSPSHRPCSACGRGAPRPARTRTKVLPVRGIRGFCGKPLARQRHCEMLPEWIVGKRSAPFAPGPRPNELQSGACPL